MNYLKSHLTLILALIAIMLSIFFYRTFLNMLHLYKKNIIDNYSIIIVSTKEINQNDFKTIGKIIPIDISKQLRKLKQKYKNIDFSNLKVPFFYKLKLNYLPSPKELKNLKDKLLNYTFIKKVMTKSTEQTKIYNLLMLIEIVSKTFMGLISILGFLLIIKQLEVWKLQHSERMYIMELFGAPFWFKGAALFKIAIIDAFISIAISVMLIYFISNLSIFNQIILDLNINFKINFLNEFLFLSILGLIISFISSILVVVGKK